jgi:hypothetical protein
VVAPTLCIVGGARFRRVHDQVVDDALAPEPIHTVLGCVPFVTVLAYLGHVAGSNWEKVQKVLAPLSYLVFLAIAVLLVVYVARRWKKVRAEYAALDAARDPH